MFATTAGEQSCVLCDVKNSFVLDAESRH